ncbi:MAG TPA: copper-binding protein, partial [Burkholderiales bacterium]|nr:copper-binding protein [Burkholderiales bacterium]
MKKLAAIVLATAFAAPGFAQQASSDHDAQHPAQLSDGEVRKVDKQAKKITIKHGPLANLDMPAMTMVFQVKDPALLDQIKAGDRVKFQAEKVGSAL